MVRSEDIKGYLIRSQENCSNPHHYHARVATSSVTNADSTNDLNEDRDSAYQFSRPSNSTPSWILHGHYCPSIVFATLFLIAVLAS